MRTISGRGVLLALGALLLSAQTPPPPAAVTDNGGAASPGLPAGTAHDLTVRVCSACHAPEIVTQQRLSRDGWHELVNTMASRGAQATDEELEQITDYLAAHYPEGSSR